MCIRDSVYDVQVIEIVNGFTDGRQQGLTNFFFEFSDSLYSCFLIIVYHTIYHFFLLNMRKISLLVGPEATSTDFAADVLTNARRCESEL